MFRGWAQVAFATELVEPVQPVDVAGTRLVAVRQDGAVRVFDGTCPHRGAHLGHGGRLDGQALVCPFHGHRIGLGCADAGPLRVVEHRTLVTAGGVFVLLDHGPDTGLADRLGALARTHDVVEGFALTLRAAADLVIENVVDADHFGQVHAVRERPILTVTQDADGSLRVDGALGLDRPNQWQAGQPEREALSTRFVAHVHSPMLVVTELGPPEAAHTVITAATPTASTPGEPPGCVVRVTAALPRREGRPTTVRDVASILSGARTAFAQDGPVWEHLDPDAVPHWLPGDTAVRRYRSYLEAFRPVAADDA